MEPRGSGPGRRFLRHGLAELDRTPLRDGADRRAAAVMRDRLQVWLASATAQDWARELEAGFLAPPAMDRMALATAPLADADDAELLASRLSGVPAGMQGYAVALQLGLEEGRPGAGVLAERPAAAVEGRNDFGEEGYSGPLPPVGDGPHRCLFRVFAASAPLGLTAGASAQDLRRALEGKELPAAPLSASTSAEHSPPLQLAARLPEPGTIAAQG